jgi:hypothetical protein
MKAPWSLMTSRSVASELPGCGVVRPAMSTSSWKPPPREMSQATMPLGPQAAQDRSDSSTSVRASGAFSETNCIGPSSWGIGRPVTGWFSVVPESIR